MNLEERVVKLEKSIDILKHTVRELLVQNQTSKVEVPEGLVSNQDVKVKKDRVLIQSLLERSKEEFHTKFLSNILNNKYDTLTPKQYQVLVNIQNNI